MKIKTMTRMALLSAIALTIFWVEAQIPMPISVPGVKLGLANVVTVYAVFSLGAWEAGAAAHRAVKPCAASFPWAPGRPGGFSWFGFCWAPCSPVK